MVGAIWVPIGDEERWPDTRAGRVGRHRESCQHQVTVPDQVGMRELRDSLTTTMRRARAGETIEVTHRGVAIAVIAPIQTDRVGRLVAGGDVTPGVALR
jgi:antitoxin (DNA-binding transcriptional repressor) of toxin-antitoxin stability system